MNILRAIKQRVTPLLASLSAAPIILATGFLVTPRRRRMLATGTILAVGVALTFGIIATARTSPPQPVVEKAWPVSTVAASPASLAPMLSAYGRVESSRVARLRSSLDAPIAMVFVHEGDAVEQGTLLLQIDPRQFQLERTERAADLAQAEAHLQTIRNDFARSRAVTTAHAELTRISAAKLRRYGALFKTGMVPVAVLDEVREQSSQRAIALAEHRAELADFPNRIHEQQALVQRARALRDRAQLDLDEASVRAPFAGPVLAVHVAVGDRANAPELIEMADASALEMRTAIADRHIRAMRAALQHGQVVQAVTHVDGRPIAMTLTHIAEDIKAGQGAIDTFFKPVHGVAANTASFAANGLSLGRVFEITVSLPVVNDVIALPLTSLYEGDRVYRIDHSRLAPVSVQRVGDNIGADGQLRVLVRSSGLKQGALVIATQLPKATAGLLVAPVNAALPITSTAPLDLVALRHDAAASSTAPTAAPAVAPTSARG